MIKRFLGVLTAPSWGETQESVEQALKQFLADVDNLQDGMVRGKKIGDNLPIKSPEEAVRFILAHRNFRSQPFNYWPVGAWLAGVGGLCAYTFADPSVEGALHYLLPSLSLLLLVLSGYVLSLWQTVEAAKYAMRVSYVVAERWQNAVFDQASSYLGPAWAVSLIDAADLQVCKELDRFVTPILAHNHEPLTNRLIDQTVQEAKSGKYAPDAKVSRWSLRGFRSTSMF